MVAPPFPRKFLREKEAPFPSNLSAVFRLAEPTLVPSNLSPLSYTPSD